MVGYIIMDICPLLLSLLEEKYVLTLMTSHVTVFAIGTEQM